MQKMELMIWATFVRRYGHNTPVCMHDFVFISRLLRLQAVQVLRKRTSRAAQLNKQAAILGAASILRHSLAQWALAVEFNAAKVVMHREQHIRGSAITLWREYAARKVRQRHVVEEMRERAGVRVLRVWRVVATRKRAVRHALEEGVEKQRIRRLRDALAVWRETCR